MSRIELGGASSGQWNQGASYPKTRKDGKQCDVMAYLTGYCFMMLHNRLLKKSVLLPQGKDISGFQGESHLRAAHREDNEERNYVLNSLWPLVSHWRVNFSEGLGCNAGLLAASQEARPHAP